MEFNWPYAFVLLILPLLLPSRREQNIAPRLPERLRLSLARIGKPAGASGRFRSLLRTLLWFFFVTAMAQPHIDGGSSVRPATGRAIVLALDLSASMSTRDFSRDGNSQSRLETVKQVATDFVARRAGDRIGLVLFGSHAFVASPLTFDTGALQAAIDDAELGLAGRTTAIGQALGLGILRLREDPADKKAIILVTDGHNNAGGAEPEKAAELAGEFGIVVHTIGLGQEQTSTEAESARVDFDSLKEIARISGGGYFSAASTEELKSVYRIIDTLDTSGREAPPVALRRDVRNLFLVIALGLLSGLLVYDSQLTRYRRSERA